MPGGWAAAWGQVVHVSVSEQHGGAGMLVALLKVTEQAVYLGGDSYNKHRTTAAPRDTGGQGGGLSPNQA